MRDESMPASQFPKLKFDSDLDCYTCRHQLGEFKVKVYLDNSEEGADLEQLKQSAQTICDNWPERHERLCRIAARELVSAGRVGKKTPIKPVDCLPFSLRVAADSEGEISYSIGFNVKSVLGKDEYVEVEEEINGKWTNSDVCCTE
jgi:hypothetical protein